MTDMLDPGLILAYLENAKAALANQQFQHAETLLTHAEELVTPVLHQATGSAASHPQITFVSGIGLDTGKKRRGRQNEDYVFSAYGVRELAGDRAEPFGLFIVADGMGGHTRGYEAAHLATHTCVDYIFPRVKDASIRGSALETVLEAGVQEANRVVFERNQQFNATLANEATRVTMGTTMTALLIVGAMAYIANVGDSRTYLWNQSHFIQITEDHSLTAQLVKVGAIASHQVYTHPQRNRIYRCLGDKEQIIVDIFHGPLQDGDVLLLCSDGLWEMVSEQARIALILATSHLCAQEMAQRLVQLALDGGGEDNIGLVVVQVKNTIFDAPTLFLN